MRLLLLFIMCGFFANAQQDYILKIGDKTYEIGMNETNSFVLNGKSTEVQLLKKDTLVYKDVYFQFKHLKDFSVSKTVLDKSVNQMMMMTASGSGVLIQSHNALNPSMLKELMLNEMTKESVGYGYSIKRDDYKRTLISGEEIEVLKATLEYKGEQEIFEVMSYGKRDEGFLMVTMNTLGDDDKAGLAMIDLVWKSLKVIK